MASDTLLVPIDFSGHADAALDFAGDLAKQLGAELHLVHAYAMPFGVTFPYDVVVSQEVLNDVRNEATRRVQAICKRVESGGLACKAHVLGSAPVDAILDTARDVDARMIVMGTRGLTGIKHALLGSVAERVVRLAPCPVVTVKGDDEED